MPIKSHAFYSIKRPTLVQKLKKRTIKKVPGGNFGISQCDQMIFFKTPFLSDKDPSKTPWIKQGTETENLLRKMTILL